MKCMSNVYSTNEGYPNELKKKPSLFRPNHTGIDNIDEEQLQGNTLIKVNSNELLNKSPREMILMKQISQNQQMINYLKNEQS